MVVITEEELEEVVVVRDAVVRVLVVNVVVVVDLTVDEVDREVSVDVGGAKMGTPDGGMIKVAVSVGWVFGKAVFCPLHIFKTLAGAGPGSVSWDSNVLCRLRVRVSPSASSSSQRPIWVYPNRHCSAASPTVKPVTD